ncbi:MAG TPA: glycosyltransferase family 4 protein [Vicinamibacterales bacterium]|nr:glycosyltransferase family 4 protein [Vicinamibacterales bacterium]
MRILIANDGFGDAGGVQSYLDRVAGGLVARGHAIAILHRDAKPAPFAADATYSLPQFSVATRGVDAALDDAGVWRPDVCFSHNMDRLEVDRAMAARWPLVKFMHGYLGTCIGGQKRYGFPAPVPCDRVFGRPCLALYGPRHCGELTVSKFVGQYRWACAQRDVFPAYRAVVVASDHMKREFTRNGIAADRIFVNPLFPTHDEAPEAPEALSGTGASNPATVAFMGRMTVLKGGDLLLRAVADASARLGRPVRAVMIGDGPQLEPWRRLAGTLGVDATFTGWLKGADRWNLVRTTTLLALPSTWPEPFGLVGLEAAALGVPAIAFDVGGVRQWLRPEQSGVVVSGPPRADTFAGALASVLGDPSRLDSLRRGAIAVAREMTLDAHLDRLETIFQLRAES